MSKILERITGVHYDAMRRKPPTFVRPWEALSNDEQRQLCDFMRFAIAAMREPTEVMYDIAKQLEAKYKHDLKSFEVTGFCALVYQAMIDAALR